MIACAKGIERGTHQFMTEVIAASAPNAIPAILSGPSFADDVARGLPTAVTLAATDEQLASALVLALGSSTFRPYHTTDVRGVEIGGAAKNVLAIAAGIVVGRSLGASALAALTTRGVHSDVLRFCREELLADNYFHAVLEAVTLTSPMILATANTCKAVLSRKTDTVMKTWLLTRTWTLA